MDWSNERYVRIYTRNTADLLAIGWQGRLVWYELLRAADRSGLIDGGDEPAVLADMLRLPVDVLEPGLEAVLARKMAAVTATPPGIVIPNYQAANETPMSDAARQREARERRRMERRLAALEGATSQNVTDESQNVMEPSRAVTPGHAASRAVTPCRTVPYRTVEDHVEGKPRHHASILAELAIEYLNSKTGGSRKVGKAVLEQFRQIAKDGYTEDEVKAVVDAKLAEWGKDEKMSKYLRPSALFRPSNFRRYVDDLDGAPAGKQSGQPSPEWEAWQESRGGKPPT